MHQLLIKNLKSSAITSLNYSKTPGKISQGNIFLSLKSNTLYSFGETYWDYDQKFAIVHEPLSSQGTLTVDMKGYHVILLAPIEAKKDISVLAQR